MKGLSRLRAQIETLDLKIVRLLNERLNLSTEVGRVKRRTHCSPFAPEREEYLLRFLEEKNSGPLLPAHLRSIYHEIFSSSRSRQAPLAIAYLGTPVSGALLAARTRFGTAETYRPHASWKALLSALRSGKAQVGVVPASALVQAAQASGSAFPLGKTLRVCGEIPPDRNLGGETYYLIAPVGEGAEAVEEENGAKKISLFRASLPADTGRDSFPRWCRRHRFRPIQPIGTLLSASARLIETGRSGKPPVFASLETSLQSTFGPQARLHLLGAFAPHPYGR